MSSLKRHEFVRKESEIDQSELAYVVECTIAGYLTYIVQNSDQSCTGQVLSAHLVSSFFTVHVPEAKEAQTTWLDSWLTTILKAGSGLVTSKR